MSSSMPENGGAGTAFTAVLESLEDARAAAVSFQAQMQTQLDAVQAELVQIRQASAIAEADAIQIRRTLTAAEAEREQLARERDQWRDLCAQKTAAEEQTQAQMAALARGNRNLHAELLELYRDLRAEDLPTLILRIGLSLTEAEQGLCTDATGEAITAAVGLDDLTNRSHAALFAFTREATRQLVPVVRNEAQSLPDGPQLANVAAVPVAMKGTLSGALLVANKRSGPFTDHETELLLSVGRHAGVALENQRLHHALSESYLSTIAVLADAIEAKDPYTRGHCEEVASIAVQVARRMAFSGDALDQLRYAALLHDVGKIGISDGILLKPGRLLPEEFEVIKRHATIGSDLVSRVPSLAPIAPFILHHHERFDGAGYPRGLSGETIPLASRIIGAVDALDAMTSPRPYREPVTRAEALEELRRCAGGQFDPHVVEIVEGVVSAPEGARA